MTTPKISVFLILIFLISTKLTHAQQQSTSSPPPQQSQSPYGNFTPSMVIVMVVILFAFFSMAIFTVFLRSCAEISYTRESPTISVKSCPRGGLDPSVISTFPVFVYNDVKELKIGKGALECAVCLSEFEDDDTLRLIPKCDHVFHPECIDAWLDCHVTCPVCRATLSGNEEIKVIDVESERGGDEGSRGVIATSEGVDRREGCESNGRNGIVIMGKFPRSHSTGHSLVQAGECTERYTLRLSEEVRRQLAVVSVSGKVLKRTRSFDVISRKGGGGEGSSRGRWRSWVMSMTPPKRRFGGGCRDSDGSSRGRVFPTRSAV